jgi:hypothetical protein
VSANSSASAPAAEPMLIDRVQPRYDATTIQHVVVDAPPERAYAAALDADLAALAQRDLVFKVLFGLRVLPERLMALLRGTPAGQAAEPPSDWRLSSLRAEGEWVRLDEAPGRELVFGAIGRFWGAKISWETIDAADFAGFDHPGFGKVACAISARTYGEGRALLSYEARTAVTDPQSRTAFLRYWRALSPFIGVLMHRTLTAIGRDAEQPR